MNICDKNRAYYFIPVPCIPVPGADRSMMEKGQGHPKIKRAHFSYKLEPDCKNVSSEGITPGFFNNEITETPFLGI